REPVAVLGAVAAQRLGIDRVYGGERIWLGGQWFYVAGILTPAVLAPEIDTSVLVGFGAAKSYLGFDGHPTTIYLRARTDQVEAVQSASSSACSRPPSTRRRGTGRSSSLRSPGEEASQPRSRSARSPASCPRCGRRASRRPRLSGPSDRGGTRMEPADECAFARRPLKRFVLPATRSRRRRP